MLSTLALTVLAALALAAPTDDVQHGTTARYIKWTNENSLAVCGSWKKLANGKQLYLFRGGYNRNCRLDWTFVTGGAHTTIEMLEYDGTRYCLDAGLNPGNGVRPHIWECIDGAPQQTWTVHPPGTVELAGRGLCLDVPDGSTADGATMQLYRCYEGNTNQLWHFPTYA